MHIRTQAGARGGTAMALIGAALLVAACGSSASAGAGTGAVSTPAHAGYGIAPQTTSTVTVTAPVGVKIATAHGSVGTYLVGPTGRAVYMWAADKNGISSCSGACAQAWPPVTTKGPPVAGGGAVAADLNTIKRADGTFQVTYKGHPLYYFVADTAPGSTKGNGSNSYGAKWWLLSASGGPVSGGGSSSSSSSSSGGGGYG
ncbi:MAG TPA: hypothetical protein VKT31_13595 [Solirubrobacteraceae bacterium]|nr:hypothetical protein [Solirubrobacteraceae bacterium]